jgi:hypothetical protein
MSLGHDTKKGGLVPEAAEVDFFGRTNLSDGLVWTKSDVSTSYATSFSAGDRAFWKLESLTPTQIIDKLKDGSLALTIWALENNGISSGATANLQNVNLRVFYTEPAAGGNPGRRGAVLIGF